MSQRVEVYRKLKLQPVFHVLERKVLASCFVVDDTQQTAPIASACGVNAVGDSAQHSAAAIAERKFGCGNAASADVDADGEFKCLGTERACRELGKNIRKQQLGKPAQTRYKVRKPRRCLGNTE